MTNGVGIVGSGQGATAFAVVPPSTTLSSTSSSSLNSTNASNGAASSAASNVHSPRLIDDPSAGFITEYLSANGSQVIYQTPSAVTVAYLKLGLTADGLTKSQAAQAGTVTA